MSNPDAARAARATRPRSNECFHGHHDDCQRCQCECHSSELVRATREQEIESIDYQADCVARNRPYGAYPCMNEFPGMPSRWCSGCLIAALLARPDLRQQVQELQAERDEAKRLAEKYRLDCVYHADCRPNRQQAEAAIADAKAMNDKWADEVAARRAAEARVAALEAELAAHKR